jgi:hypothetical protein
MMLQGSSTKTLLFVRRSPQREGDEARGRAYPRGGGYVAGRWREDGDNRELVLSDKFAKSGGNKWYDIVVVPGVTGVPLLPTWLACFECKIYARYDGGDHEIGVGQVINLQNGVSREGE